MTEPKSAIDQTLAKLDEAKRLADEILHEGRAIRRADTFIGFALGIFVAMVVYAVAQGHL